MSASDDEKSVVELGHMPTPSVEVLQDSNHTYILLSDVNHLLQFSNMIGVITSISPILKRNKLDNVIIQISDWTLHNPGFTIKLNLPSEVLDRFLKFGKVGSIIDLLEIRVLKNDGEVYGEVTDKEEMRLFGDRADHVKWHSKEKNCSISGKHKSTIKKLLAWKESYFNQKDPVIDCVDQKVRSLRKKEPDSKNTGNSSSSKLEGPENEAGTTDKSRDLKRNITRSRSTASLHTTSSRTPKTNNKKVEKSTISRAQSVSSLNKSFEGSENEAKTADKNGDLQKSMVRSRSTASLNKDSSRTPKTNNKKVEKSTMSRAQNLSSISSSFEGPENEAGNTDKNRDLKRNIMRSRSTASLHTTSSRTPKTSYKKVEKSTITRAQNVSSINKSFEGSENEAETADKNGDLEKSMVRSRSTASLNKASSRTPKTNNKKVEKSTISRAQSVYSLNKSFEGSENEAETADKNGDLQKSMVRSRSTASLNKDSSRTPKTNNKKVEKSTISRAQNVSSISSSFEGPENEAGTTDKNLDLKRNIMRSRSTASLHTTSSRTPKTSYKKVEKSTITRAQNVSSINKSFEGSESEAETADKNGDLEKSMVRSRSTASLHTTSNKTPKTNNIKVDKSTISRAQSVSSLKKCFEGPENEAGNTDKNRDLKRNIMRSRSTASLHTTSSRTPKTSYKKVEKSTISRAESVSLLNSSFEGSENKDETADKNGDLKKSMVRSRSSEVSNKSFNLEKKTNAVYLNSSDSSIDASPESHSKEPESKTTLQKRKHTRCSINESEEFNQTLCVKKNSKKPKLLDTSNSMVIKIQENKPLNEIPNDNNSSVTSWNDESKERTFDDSNKQNESQSNKSTLKMINPHDESSKQSLEVTKQKNDNLKFNSQKSDVLSNKQTHQETSEEDTKQTTKRNAQSLTIKRNFQQKNQNKPIRSALNDTFERRDWCIRFFTRKVYFEQASTLELVSQSEIEDICVPEKFDLTCKVISYFNFYEEDIQVVRVQDGSIQKTKSLVIPERSSWKDVAEKVSNSPVVKANLPFIDIIIFEFSRMDTKIRKDLWYQFQNVMAVKFLPKNTKITENLKNALFYCGKGQNMYTKKLKIGDQEKMEGKLKEEEYQAVWNTVVDDEGYVSVGNLLKTPENSSSQLQMRNQEKTDLAAMNQSKTHKKNNDASGIKRKLIEGDVQLTKRSQMDIDEVEMFDIVEKETKLKHMNTTNVEKRVQGSQPKSNHSDTRSEALSGTLSELQESLDILQEGEEDIELTETADVHLKNSGSEVTFSQFCKGAETKARNFRTSTQNQNVSEDIVALKTIPSDSVGESVKMDPLEYYSSSSPSIASISYLKHQESSQKKADSDNFSESVLKPLSDISRSKVKLSHFKPDFKNDCNLSKHKCSEEIKICDSESVNVVSSKSSDSDVELIKIVNSKIKEIPNSVAAPQTNLQVIKGDEVSEITEVSDNSESIFCDFIHYSEINNSSFGGNAQRKQSIYSKTEKENQSKKQNWSFLSQKNIPDKYFFNSALSMDEEDVNSVHSEDDAMSCTYSHPQNAPFLQYSLIQKIKNKNFITINVVLKSSKPSLTASWASEIIKAECPTCHKFYSLNRATNINSCNSMALTVGSHVVCSDSQCYNQILENPKFHFSVDLKLKDGKVHTALIRNEVTERLLGYTAQEILSDREKFEKAEKTVKKIVKTILVSKPVKVDLTRENICDKNSGPLYLQNLYL